MVTASDALPLDGLDNAMHWLDIEIHLARKNPIRKFGIWGVVFEDGYETLGHAYDRWQIDPMFPYNVGWLMRLYPPLQDESIIRYKCRLNEIASKIAVLERGSEGYTSTRQEYRWAMALPKRRPAQHDHERPIVQLRLF